MDFTFTQRLPVAREPLFQFHEDPENLRVLLEGWEVTTVLTTDGHIRPGARTGVLEQMGPFRMRFVFEHFLLEPPERFGERQPSTARRGACNPGTCIRRVQTPSDWSGTPPAS